MGVGCVLDLLAGKVSRAPVWMQRSGLEWLFRLVQEPGRLWKRYIVDDLPMLARLGADALGAGRGGARRVTEPTPSTADRGACWPPVRSSGRPQGVPGPRPSWAGGIDSGPAA